MKLRSIHAPLAGFVLALASLGNGLALDDQLHRLKARGAWLDGDLASRLDLFTFVPGTREGNARLADQGFLPWFASPDLRLAFFRPIAALSAFFDYVALDRWRWAMHLESALFYALVVAVAAIAYRRLVAPSIAAVAAILFAIDDAHALPIGWLANRNALFATSFVLLAVIAHDRWRRDRWRVGAIAGPSALLAGLASAELATCGLAYLVAYAITIDPEPSKRRRAWALAPYAAVVAVWQAAYRLLGFGARGSGLYLDPIASPIAFLRLAPVRALALAQGLFSFPPSDVWLPSPLPVRIALGALAIASCAFIAKVVGPLVRRDRTARFFAIGSLLALAPVLAAVPSDRLLLPAGFGAFGLIAIFFDDVRARIADATRSERFLRGAWIAIHAVFAPAFLAVGCAAIFFINAIADRAFTDVRLGPEVAQQTVVVVTTPNVLLAYPFVAPSDDGHPRPFRIRPLAGAALHVTLTREDARTVLLDLHGGPPDPLVFLFRDSPARAGDAFDVRGLHVDVVAADGAAATSLRYRFDETLDAPSMRWFAWTAGAFHETRPPAIGERVTYDAE